MRRREFIGLVGGGAVAPLLTPALRATAQQNAKIPRVGILSPAASETAATLAAFRMGIRDLGYVEGQTIVLDFRLSKGDYDAFQKLALQLIRVPVDLIVTDSTSATLAAASATRTIPIVMAASGGDPVALGFATSLNKPGGNVTGIIYSAECQTFAAAQVPLRASRFCSFRPALSGRLAYALLRRQPNCSVLRSTRLRSAVPTSCAHYC
jgi:ABC transporter substrate binding protein